MTVEAVLYNQACLYLDWYASFGFYQISLKTNERTIQIQGETNYWKSIEIFKYWRYQFNVMKSVLIYGP